MTAAFLFPGQGTQRRRMGLRLHRASAAARHVFTVASDVLGFDTVDCSATATPPELADTRLTQPMVVVVNAAAYAVLVERGVEARVAAGHSVGEFNALIWAEVLPFEVALQAVVRRADLMSAAAAKTSGAMAVVTGLEHERVMEICASTRGHLGDAVVAIVNSPRSCVVSGSPESVAWCGRMARHAGARRVAAVPVSAAFHSPLMQDVLGAWRRVVEELPLATPQRPVVLNTTGTTTRAVDAIRAALVAQITRPVLWLRVVETLARMGIRQMVEVGDSRFLAAVAREIPDAPTCVSMQDPGDALRRLTVRTPTQRPAVEVAR